MKAIKALGTIEQGRLVRLDEPLPAGVSGRVRLLIVLDEDDPSEQDWMRAATAGGGLDFLKAPEEDIDTLEDGKPLTLSAAALDAKHDDGVDLSAHVDLALAGRADGPTYSLDELVEGISTQNRHTEVSNGRRRGRESW